MPSAFKPHDVRGKIALVERCEIVNRFASADKTRWNSKFILNCNDDPAFAAAIEFSDNQTSKRHRAVEFAGLRERVATGGCLDNEQCLVRRLRIELAERPFHLLQLGH